MVSIILHAFNDLVGFVLLFSSVFSSFYFFLRCTVSKKLHSIFKILLWQPHANYSRIYILELIFVISGNNVSFWTIDKTQFFCLCSTKWHCISPQNSYKLFCLQQLELEMLVLTPPLENIDLITSHWITNWQPLWPVSEKPSYICNSISPTAILTQHNKEMF